jgi:2-dehydro-3-deoxyphosphogluconate aldolase/(4S)-4-hydroxy-2-oxoglutarate aldolase
MPTGGVTTEVSNLKAWFDAGVTCVGLGSQLISQEILTNKDFSGLESTVRETLGSIIKLRK